MIGRPKGSKDKKKRKKRRRLPRPAKRPALKRPATPGASERMRAYNLARSADPERAAAQREHLRNIQWVLIPWGMTAAQAERHWRKCYRKADLLMSELENEGVINFLAGVPEEEMAKLALREAFALALSKLSAKEKIAAINTVLAYTKAKPATKTDLRLNNAEAWLAEVVADHKASNDGSAG